MKLPLEMFKGLTKALLDMSLGADMVESLLGSRAMGWTDGGSPARRDVLAAAREGS